MSWFDPIPPRNVSSQDVFVVAFAAKAEGRLSARVRHVLTQQQWNVIEANALWSMMTRDGEPIPSQRGSERMASTPNAMDGAPKSVITSDGSAPTSATVTVS